jgi:hypothetical protein
LVFTMPQTFGNSATLISIRSMIIAWHRELLFRTSARHKTDDFTPFPCVGRKCKLKHIRLIGRIYLQIITIRN